MIRFLRLGRVILYMLWKLPGLFVLEKLNPDKVDEFVDKAAQKWSKLLLWVFEVELEISGRENFPASHVRPVVIMANHQSQLDIPALFVATNCTLGFVAKKELTKVPILNHWMVKIGCVFIDRKNRSAARRSIETAAQIIGTHPMVLFPEGTRSKTGELLPLKPGGARLAILSRAWIQPIRIQGTRKGWEGRKRFKGKVKAKVTILPPFDASEYADEKKSLLEIRDKVLQSWESVSPT